MPLRVWGRVFSTFLSVFTGTVTVPRVGFRLETGPNSSESSLEFFRDLRGEEVVQEREDRLYMRGRRDDQRAVEKGENELSRGERATNVTKRPLCVPYFPF